MINTLTIEILGYTALSAGVLSYLTKKQNTIRFALGISSFVWAIYFYCLGAFTASSIQMLLALRSWSSNIFGEKHHKNLIFWISSTIIIALTAYTWQGYSSIIPLIAALNSSVAFCYMDNKNMRKMLFASSALWMLNGLVWQSIPQMITEAIKMALNLYTFMGMDKRNEFTHQTYSTQIPIEMTKEDYEFENKVRKTFEHDAD